jgi:hypothetical protein
MLRFAADENFNGDIVRGLLRRAPTLDVVRVQDVGLSGADDSAVLEWAAAQGRIVASRPVSRCPASSRVRRADQSDDRRSPAAGRMQPSRRVGGTGALPATLREINVSNGTSSRSEVQYTGMPRMVAQDPAPAPTLRRSHKSSWWLLLPAIGWLWLLALLLAGLLGFAVRRHHFESAGIAFGIGFAVFAVLVGRGHWPTPPPNSPPQLGGCGSSCRCGDPRVRLVSRSRSLVR